MDRPLSTFSRETRRRVRRRETERTQLVRLCFRFSSARISRAAKRGAGLEAMFARGPDQANSIPLVARHFDGRKVEDMTPAARVVQRLVERPPVVTKAVREDVDLAPQSKGARRERCAGAGVSTSSIARRQDLALIGVLAGLEPGARETWPAFRGQAGPHGLADALAELHGRLDQREPVLARARAGRRIGASRGDRATSRRARRRRV
jgi:hypothetical protein